MSRTLHRSPRRAPVPPTRPAFQTTTEYTCTRDALADKAVAVSLTAYPGAEWGSAEDRVRLTFAVPTSRERAQIECAPSELDELCAALAHVVAQYKTPRRA